MSWPEALFGCVVVISAALTVLVFATRGRR